MFGSFENYPKMKTFKVAEHKKLAYQKFFEGLIRKRNPGDYKVVSSRLRGSQKSDDGWSKISLDWIFRSCFSVGWINRNFTDCIHLLYSSSVSRSHFFRNKITVYEILPKTRKFWVLPVILNKKFINNYLFYKKLWEIKN